MKYHLYSRSAVGKLRQIGRALWLELRYSKAEILEAYLNLVPVGKTSKGVGAASFVYFGKPPSKLQLGEALTLAVIPQSPARRAPDRTTAKRYRRRARPVSKVGPTPSVGAARRRFDQAEAVFAQSA